ncbi:unnamed protein product [Zymoseptoria tritici ST99CH_1A5]|uniref:BHLH domain-containing protein n=3 Tax=Zymoseptoria tritici TaxID=1047171 RepID=F9WWQ2_ZYMTI|nr:uncharacterized protein MYCGRDRAFT_89727 [Zymoseptoria tritici IPO323]EGP91464.1 hypothetical protein MYCGRDRAFT_89727 [Zymoseptoria tritici IPO323]SMR42652.1 unnamed protein product [Zymoseptoria tritici ST99CH_1E4]SMR44828.1 unnamed protein product [Zymoseptoria tritici ST99CH_3D1]SMY19993.1 unnamed protein product [Zymoseptoria tritici ST99CH_1A5]
MASPATAAQQHQGLPSITTLTNGLRPSAPISPDQQSTSDTTRDSGTWPQPQNKHNSANSGLQVHTLLNHPDESPSRSSIPNTPSSARIPASATSQLPSINQGFADNNANRESYNSYNSRDSYNRDSLGRELNRDSYQESRRSSVDSRMHQGFNSLYINGPGPHSPYESANTSQVSLAASLRRPNGNPMSPHSARSSLRGNPAPRIAPPIMPVNRGPGVPDPTASKPTQGYAWAFPDEAIPEERRGSDSGESSVDHNVSRQNSYAASSVRSSIFSVDSQMPHGQRRFQEDDPNTTHHHSMQHRSIQGLQSDDMTPQGVGNYSRTPELRVSHKLAERKRRSEMKDLFEDLNKAVPSSGGTKASKWEILTKAIEYIRTTQHQERNLHAEIQRLQRETEYSREAHKENEELKTEVQVMYQHLRRLDPNATHMYGRLSQQLSQQQGQLQTNGNPNISLPPLNTASGASQSGSFGGAPGAPMQGVEYNYSAGR